MKGLGIAVILVCIVGSSASASEDPVVGVYQMNFKYDKVKIFSEISNSKVTLPILKSSYYTEVTYQLVCKASYPIQWTYSGFRYPQAQATTSRISSNDLGEAFSNIFEARVIFSFTEASHSGKYICKSLTNPELQTFVDISIAGNDGKIIDYVTETKVPGIQPTSDLQISQQSVNTIICCSSSNGFPKLTYQKCESVSDCGLRLSYMENKPECKGRSCKAGSLQGKQEMKNGKKCSSYDVWDESGGLVKCSGVPNVQNEYIMFTTSENDKKLITDFKATPAVQDVLNIYVEPVGTGEIFISCVPNLFFFSHGVKWGVQSQTGLKILNDDKNTLRVNKNDFIGQTVFCFAPLWDSEDWRNASVIIK